MADKIPESFVSKNMGFEVDASLDYAIMDKLSLSVFGGYFSPGDYYKGTDEENKVDAAYLIGTELIEKF